MNAVPEYPEMFILRHGETEWNREGRMQGALDSPLTPNGKEQARAQQVVMQRYAGAGFTWYSSPQGRALETARIAAPDGAKIIQDVRLAEIRVGKWSGKLRSEMAADAPDLFPPIAGPLDWYGKAPGGETLDELAGRVSQFLAELPGPSAIVTHGITSRVIRCIVLGRPITDFSRLEGGQGIAYYLAPGRYDRVSTTGIEPQAEPNESQKTE